MRPRPPASRPACSCSIPPAPAATASPTCGTPPPRPTAYLLSSPTYLAGGLDQVIPIATIGGGTRTQTWHYPSQGECLTCHTSYSGFVLGPKTRQLNGAFTYPVTGVSDNQLRTWNYLEMFTTTLAEAAIPGYTHMQPPSASGDTLVDRVKSYLGRQLRQLPPSRRRQRDLGCAL